MGHKMCSAQPHAFFRTRWLPAVSHCSTPSACRRSLLFLQGLLSGQGKETGSKGLLRQLTLISPTAAAAQMLPVPPVDTPACRLVKVAQSGNICIPARWQFDQASKPK